MLNQKTYWAAEEVCFLADGLFRREISAI